MSSNIETREKGPCAILEAVAFAAESLLRHDRWRDALPEILDRLGRSACADRAYVFENIGETARICTVWSLSEAPRPHPTSDEVEWQGWGIGRWRETFVRKGSIAGSIDHFPANERRLLAACRVGSLAAVPIFAGPEWWGLVSFTDQDRRRSWPDSEIDALRTAAGLIGAAIARGRVDAERNRLAKAVEQTSESVVVTDPQGAIQYVNPAFERTTGWTCREVIGRNPRFLKSGRQDSDFYRTLWKTITAGRVWRGSFVNCRKDGSFFEEEATIAPFRESDGAIRGFVAVKRDVTELRGQERRFERAERLQALGRLAGGVAHDFNNVMAQILVATERLRTSRPFDASRSRYFDLIQGALERGRTVAARMLEMARPTNGGVRDEDAVEIVDRLIEIGRHTFPRRIELRRRIDIDDVAVRVSRADIEQVLLNLAINAVDAMPERGALTFRLREARAEEIQESGVDPTLSYVCFEVSDEGPGIPEAVRDRIFEPFFTTKDPGRGTGLGLSIAQEIIRGQGGWLAVADGAESGATFVVGLPIGSDPEANVVVAETEDRSRIVPGTTLLLIDDETALLELLADFFAEAGFRCLTAASGEEAIEILTSEKVDLVLTDFGLPGLGGTELLGRIAELVPEIPVVVSSGYLGVAGVEEMVAEVLPKPFLPEEALATVERLLRPDHSTTAA